jgi:hypothetical protein
VRTLEISETFKETRYSYQNALVWLLSVSEPGGQRDPGSPDFGSGLTAVIFGFPQVAPQRINGVLRFHGILCLLLISAENQLFFTGESRQAHMRQFFIYRGLRMF